MRRKKKPAARVLAERKAKHITICVEPGRYQVEPVGPGPFAGLQFLHNPLPELAEETLDTRIDFLEHSLRLPLFISCMTGGSAAGRQANKIFARVAQHWKIPVGMGSFRILFEQPELFDHFYLKALVPDAPVLGNIGIVQIRDLETGQLIEMAKKLEIQALAIHLNPGQELFQPGGDKDFYNLKKALAVFRKQAPFPLIIKETGFGIPPALVAYFTELGIDYIDLAGKGGTNWVSVESYRLPDHLAAAAREFADWGYTTPLLLDLLAGRYSHILASGGLRTGSDLAKTLALGACLGGMALPFIRAVQAGGEQAAHELLEKIEKSLRSIMVLCGVPNITALRQISLLRSTHYREQLADLKVALEL